jgi:benzoyl-CoA 2,3-dioxygenase component B
MLNALNEVLRDDDSMGGVARWNKVIEKAGIPFRLTVPHKAFNRKIGTSRCTCRPPALTSRMGSQQGQMAGHRQDRKYVASLMGRVVEPGKFANWIAPPAGHQPPAD